MWVFKYFYHFYKFGSRLSMGTEFKKGTEFEEVGETLHWYYEKCIVLYYLIPVFLSFLTGGPQFFSISIFAEYT